MIVTQKHPDKESGVFLAHKKTGLLYSLCLTVGSVSLFASMIALNTAYQGFIWSYSTRYIVNSFTLAFALFLSGAFLIVACVQLLRERSSARIFGFVGVGFLIAYSLFILFIDRYIAYTLVYVLMLLVLFAFIVTGAVFFFYKKSV
jgi:hypothetical protein